MKTTNMAAAASAAVSQVDSTFPWSARLRAFPEMLGNVVFFRRVKDRGVSRFRVDLALLGLLYVVSPVDFLPEIIMGPLGMGDDLAVAVVSLVYLVKSTDRWLESEPTVNVAPSTVWVERDDSGIPPASGDVILGEIV